MLKSITLRFNLFMLYGSLAVLSLFSPKHGRQLLDDAEEGAAAMKARTKWSPR